MAEMTMEEMQGYFEQMDTKSLKVFVELALSVLAERGIGLELVSEETELVIPDNFGGEVLQ